ncbi:MAG TPA: type VI secretion protein IcmF/TssM N-terminal domain-containing protein, partial [Bryobacteraceae bacterium]
MNYQVMILAGFVGYIALAWFATVFLKLTGVDLWVVRGFLFLLGLSGAGLVWWILSRRKKGGDAAGEDAAAQGGADEIDILIRDAEARLAGSNLGKTGNLPVILLAGPPGSAKTSIMIHSGLEPELIAGQVYQENAVTPTRSANLWFARQILFVDSGGAVLHTPPRWLRLVKRLEPRKLSAALGGGGQAPRAAVVCFDVEEFLKPGAPEGIPAAVRNLQARLGDISQALGISFPVYVLFTKCDRLPFFLDYVRNATNEEAAQVLGVTLPIETGQPAGVYAERATHLLTGAFDELFYSLADKRAEFLAREHAAEKLPGVYEFPREFRKLRAMLVQFLVDLSKPSQLRAAPFLRGFYFSGVRPVVVTEMSQPAAPQPAERAGFDARSGATGLFHAAQGRPQQTAQPQAVGTRRVPQWLFLSHFWNDVILSDRNAISVSGSSVKASTLRRVLFASAAGLCLLYSFALVISYARNSSLEGRVLEAARGVSAAPPNGSDLPSADTLKRIDALRQELVTLGVYEREG